ncbi:hypothetical protein DFJ74DRAFT_669654 [Hyaloraphidium curvatum]|nr:hypothetical protein DFJ74DRAFT_669654 [Hyaloraphidium curvatum]
MSSAAPPKTRRRALSEDNVFEGVVPPDPEGDAMRRTSSGASSSRAFPPPRKQAIAPPNVISALKPSGGGKPAQQRTTKIASKLVLLPDADEPVYDVGPRGVHDPEGLEVFVSSENEVVVPWLPPEIAKTEAERMTRQQRRDLPRVTGFCTADEYNLKDLRTLLTQRHSVASWVSYDECLYAKYDRQSIQTLHDLYDARSTGRGQGMIFDYLSSGEDLSTEDRNPDDERRGLMEDYEEGDYGPQTPTGKDDVQDSLKDSEIFFFEYGCVVFWNFSEVDEQRILSTIFPCSVEPLKQDDVETDDFSFQYDPSPPYQPRIFNDLITLKSTNPLNKLVISHAIAQSVKLNQFENLMEETIDATKGIPETMAQTGEVGLSREAVVMTMGRLFNLRMGVNLVSNVLDDPDFLWDKPELQPVYSAMRTYLEINPRTTILNKRTEVIADLLDLLNDHLSSSKMSSITWIIIYLIIVACIVAVAEIAVKASKLAPRQAPRLEF